MPERDRELEEVLRFWFEELEPKHWFKKDDAIDERIRDRFGPLYKRVAERIPPQWQETPEGCLAAVLVLDQFPRNMFRDDPRAFATDASAHAMAEHAIERGFDRSLPPAQRKFLYVPFQHSEDPSDQARSVELCATLDDPKTLDYAERHKAIIDRFGRFPHRNAVLERECTADELAFLEQPKSSF